MVELAVISDMAECSLSARSSEVSTALQVHFGFFEVDKISWQPRRTYVHLRVTMGVFTLVLEFF